jgi:hypothetical protein
LESRKLEAWLREGGRGSLGWRESSIFCHLVLISCYLPGLCVVM